MDLTPQIHRLPNGNSLCLFPSDGTEILKVDFTFEAGAAYQPKFCVAQAANKLFTEGSKLHTAQQIAEFLDFRGVALDRAADTATANLSLFCLQKYAADLFPLLREIFDSPVFPAEEFQHHVAQRKHAYLSSMQKTKHVAYLAFSKALYGAEHPYGMSASLEDIDRFTLDDVRQFYAQRYRLSNAQVILAGACSPQVVSLFEQSFGDLPAAQPQPVWQPQPFQPSAERRIQCPMPNAVQSSLRIGRTLPLSWDDPDYARFMVLNTILGGYFGSRLMSNIREDKGYTYGIYSQTKIMRGAIEFFISADVSAEATQPAINEVFNEIARLQNEPVPPDELQTVVRYMRGDYLRSIDGILEISERYRQMAANGITEQFAANYFQALDTITPQQIVQLARRFLAPADLTVVVAGRC